MAIRIKIGVELGGIGTMTSPRPWPNRAAWVRDSAAMTAAESIRLLRPLVAGERFSEVERTRRQAVVLANLQAILLDLTRVGARVEL